MPPRRSIRARLAADGVEIRPENVPRWGGEPCDYNMMLSWLYRERRESDVSAETSETPS
jgi:hypothetical protein